jgi:hypothetical protein
MMRVASRFLLVVGAVGCGEVVEGSADAPADGDSQNAMLAVSVTGSGIGSVSSSPGGIDCPGDCDEVFAVGTTVTLAPTANPASAFVGWSGGCSGLGACDIDVTGPVTIEARFDPGCVSGSQTFVFTGAIELFTVPLGCTTLTIDASGAQGAHAAGGLGARVTGLFTVMPGEQLRVLVGEQGHGLGGDISNYGYGGGGGSFVIRSDDSILAIAGGGGGPSWDAGSPGAPGDAGPNGGSTPGAIGGSGGTGGQFGAGGATGGCGWIGSGGGGMSGDGAVSANGGGFAFLNGGGGGTDPISMDPSMDCVVNARGGFGGGGAGGYGGGGGGGYSGGAGGPNTTYTGGGGGGSLNNGSSPVSMTGVRTGNGEIVISW